MMLKALSSLVTHEKKGKVYSRPVIFQCTGLAAPKQRDLVSRDNWTRERMLLELDPVSPLVHDPAPRRRRTQFRPHAVHVASSLQSAQADSQRCRTCRGDGLTEPLVEQDVIVFLQWNPPRTDFRATFCRFPLHLCLNLIWHRSKSPSIVFTVLSSSSRTFECPRTAVR